MNEQTTTLVPEKSLGHKIITFSVSLAAIMQSLDSTIANVALTHMQGSLAGTQDQMTWVLTSYIVASAIMIPLTGWLANYVGRKLIFLISIAGFTLASILCGIAETLPEMIMFRLLQGICGAALMPLSQAILLDINSKENFGKAMALWGVGVTLGPIIGPALGGYLTDNYNWRWVFYINVPIGLITFSGLYFFLPESKTQTSRRFDFFGFIALSLGVGALQVMLDRGELQDWFNSAEIIIESLLALLGFYLFIIHTLTFRQPFISREFLQDRNFIISNILIFVVGVVLFATLALLPSMLQNQLNYSVSTAGLVIAPRGAGTMLAMYIVGRIIGRVDARIIMAIGLLTTAFSLNQMTNYSLQTDARAIITAGIIQGIGIGFSFVPLTAVAFSTLPTSLRNEGTSLFNLMRNLGSSIGISVVEALLTRNTQIVHAVLNEHLIPYNMAANYAYTANHINPTTTAGLVSLNNMVTNQATMIAYIDDFKLIMLVTLCVIPLLFLLRTPKTSNQNELTELEAIA